MAVPATTGQLRTKVSDMQVGDYIACAYNNMTAGTGKVGFFANLGYGGNLDITGYQIPYAGTAVTNNYQYFYFIKADRGLLIADRIVQHSISWDTLNAGKVIQGSLWDAGTIIPTMTSNTAPSGVASASGVRTAGTEEAWVAFNGITGANGWHNTPNVTSGWLQYQFATPKKVTGYSLQAWASYPTANPKDWNFLGSNNGVDWVKLDIQRGQLFVNNVPRTFVFSNNEEYLYYKIDIFANGGYASMSISEMKMFETAGIIRSLTGGVAYADANRGLATVDADKGGWPVNNEYDKYIVNSNLKGKITKADDNVWHWSNIYTHTQDTWTGSQYRTTRGYTKANFANNIASSTVAASTGFRPVFEYKEV